MDELLVFITVEFLRFEGFVIVCFEIYGRGLSYLLNALKELELDKIVPNLQ